jgi:hypothetical protein
MGFGNMASKLAIQRLALPGFAELEIFDSE